MYFTEKKGNEYSEPIRVVQKKAGMNTLLCFHLGAGSPLTSCTAATLVQCSFADQPWAHPVQPTGQQEAAALLAGGAFAVFAFAGAGAGAGATNGAEAVGVHFQQR